LTDGQICLRKYRADDAYALYEAVSESIEELTPWGFFHDGFTLEDAEDEVISRISCWDKGENYSFLIEEPPNGLVVGGCGIAEIEREMNQAALGWWVRTSRTNRGIATAAGRLAALAAFEDLHFDKLFIYTRAENIASRRVAEKIGAQLVQIKLEEDGVLCAVYELKPADLQDAQRKDL
jgi:RimJ/RimL family protein N-acetyltransferase